MLTTFSVWYSFIASSAISQKVIRWRFRRINVHWLQTAATGRCHSIAVVIVVDFVVVVDSMYFNYDQIVSKQAFFYPNDSIEQLIEVFFFHVDGRMQLYTMVKLNFIIIFYPLNLVHFIINSWSNKYYGRKNENRVFFERKIYFIECPLPILMN